MLRPQEKVQLFFTCRVVFIPGIDTIPHIGSFQILSSFWQKMFGSMVSEPQETAAGSLTDRSILETLRRQGKLTINELVEISGVTATAIRQRLSRLMEQGLVVRQAESRGRGRPTHCYSLSASGQRISGNNFQDLAGALWSEIRAVEDPAVRQGLLKRIVARMADGYRDRIQGVNLLEKMKSLVGLMHERDVPFEISGEDPSLPVLTAWACPYPELAEQDRAICSMENMLFSEILGESVRLSGCRLDGESCCTFVVGARTASAEPAPSPI